MPERRETDREVASSSEGSGGERIAKYLASAGVASRRDAEKMIAEGRISVDRVVLTSPAFKVTGQEDIRLDGHHVKRPEKTRLWRYHKPLGLVTTNRDPDGRPTVFEHLPKFLPRVVTIGRLDLNTEGLLLLTNDGELARALELPSTGLERRYRARAYGRATQKDLDKLRDGIVHEGIEYRSIIATLDRSTGSNAWIDMVLTEGKKREARRALESIGLKVNRLIRVSYGGIELDDLALGEVAEVPAVELIGAFGSLIGEKRQPDPSRAMTSAEMKRPQAKRSNKPKSKAAEPKPKRTGPKPAGWAKAKPRLSKRKS
jgi:23S rRNA pseudouridine2605 synthase